LLRGRRSIRTISSHGYVPSYEPSACDSLIVQGMLDPFRVPTERHVQWETPYSFHGTAGPWDEEVVRLSFINAEVVQVSDINESQLSNSPYFSIAVTGGPLNPMGSILPAMPITARQDTWSLKVTKVGALQRKDDIADGGRRAPNRKWREWTVILTGSQLLFFRDPTWANTFLSQDEGAETPSSLLRPDELLSVKDAVAVYDRSYHKVCRLMKVAAREAHASAAVPKLPPIRHAQRTTYPPPRG
jgi:hypothetical protein